MHCIDLTRAHASPQRQTTPFGYMTCRITDRLHVPVSIEPTLSPSRETGSLSLELCPSPRRMDLRQLTLDAQFLEVGQPGRRESHLLAQLRELQPGTET